MKCSFNSIKNIETPRKFIAATLLSAPLIMLPACVNKTDSDCFKKEQLEMVNKNFSNYSCESGPQTSIFETIENYDQSILNDIRKRKGKEPRNRALSRLLVGLTAAAIGGLIGCVQKENRTKLVASIGGILGATLPGITTATIITGLTALLTSGIAGAIKNKPLGYTICGGLTALAAAICFL